MSTRPEFRKTILIGLGGAGQQIVLRTKRFFIDTYGVLPPSIKVLCLDTDDEELKIRSVLRDQVCTIDPQEFLHLQVSNPADFIRASDVVQRWYVKPVPVGAISHGAGAVRQNGRLALFYHFHEVARRLDKMLVDLDEQQLETRMDTARSQLGSTTDFSLSRRETEIYVCGSLAGGTGSGTFLDLGLLLRHMRPNALIHGFFLLPWIYRNKAFAYRVRQNAYAALSEIDSLQSVMYGDKRFVPYRVQYADHEIKVDKAPYDLFHLIDGRNEHGENIDDVEALCETMANAIFLSVGSMAFKISSVVDNLLAHVNVASPRMWGGRYARYSSLGVSSIHYPALELHRLLAARNALAICRSAIAQTSSVGAAGDDARVRHESAEQDAVGFLNQLALHRDSVRRQLCPNQAPESFVVQSFEIADSTFPSLLKTRAAAERKLLGRNLEAMYQASGRKFEDSVTQALDRRLKALAADLKVDSSTRHVWVCRVLEHVKGLRDEAAERLVAATKDVTNLQESTDKLLRVAAESRYIPLVGGNRKRATLAWAEEMGKLLTTVKAEINLQREKRFYETLIERLERDASIPVPATSEIAAALLETEGKLRSLLAREEKSLEILRTRPNHALLGYGTVVVIPGNGELREDIVLPYADFTRDVGIHNPEDYLRHHRSGPDGLVALFRDYCRDKLAYLTEVTVDRALEALATESGDSHAFVKQQFDHLFRLSAALWNVDQGRITPQQAGQMDKIVNIGLYDHQADIPRYEQVAEDAKARFRIRSDLAYSTTGDPYHIWLLNYAAAIPAYLLNGLGEAREAYLEEITPTYHVDSYLEMNVPDLFPADAIDNRVLRVLGMAIVLGIDVIRDEKLVKGHKFTCDHPAVREMNYGDPTIWLLFRDMYAEVKESYDPRRTDNFFDLLTRLLRERVNAMDRSELRACIETHIEKVRRKLDEKDFSRLVSARLTYQELRALQDFLEKPPRGYAMNLDRYLEGVLA